HLQQGSYQHPSASRPARPGEAQGGQECPAPSLRFSEDVMAERLDTIFLLSPATLSGLRAQQLASPDARFETARRFRSPGGVPVARALAFMSALSLRAT